ncbi:MAG: Gfo/Idh/MocA family oxidoreductase [Nitrososphaerota archaeon]|nr:Gfo/Idh/MocA family oxidoreductase [Nitrososphaerota archaeon]
MPTSVQRYSHAELLKDVRLDIDESIPSIAIVGFGKMGLLHSIILNLLKPNSIKYIVDKSTIVRLSGKLLLKGVKFLPSVEKLLEEDFDAVFVTTPTSTHYPVVKRLLEAGIRKIFVEKPPTSNSRELENF